MTTVIGKDISEAKKILAGGDIVAIPTETVYGLAANALNEDAVLKIFTAKNRPHFDPLIVHVGSIKQIEKYVEDIPGTAQQLIQAFMPGPFTLLLQKKSIIPDLVTSGLNTVAIRVPAHPLTMRLLNEIDFPLAAPSANPFGYISPTTAEHVFAQLQGKIPYILDGGPAGIGVESTIAGIENGKVIIYRLGGIPLEEIEDVLDAKVTLRLDTSSNPKAPGTLQSHYAPRKKLMILPLDTGSLNAEAGVIAFDQYVDGIDPTQQVLLSAKADLNEAAKNLFAAMRKLDAGDAALIYAVRFPDEGLGKAINDRLQRAAA